MKTLMILALLTYTPALAETGFSIPASALTQEELITGTEERIRNSLLNDLVSLRDSLENVREFDSRFGKTIEILQDPRSELAQLNTELASATDGLLSWIPAGEKTAAILANTSALAEMESIQSSDLETQAAQLHDAAVIANSLEEGPVGQIVATGGVQSRVIGSRAVGAAVIGIQGQAYADIAGRNVPMFFKIGAGMQDRSLTREAWARFVQPKADKYSKSVRYVLEPVYIRENGVTSRRSFAGVGIARGNPIVSGAGKEFSAIILRPLQEITQSGIVGDAVSSVEKLPSLLFVNRIAITDALRTQTVVEMGRGKDKKQLLGIEFEVEYGFGKNQTNQVFGQFVLDSATLRPVNGTGIASQKTTTTMFGIGIRRKLIH